MHPELDPAEKDIHGPGLQGRKHNPLPLSLKLVLRERVAVEMQYSPARCLEAKPFVASKMAVSLKVPDDLVSPVSENRHILPTHSAVELAQLVCSISGPGDEELSKLADSVPLLHLEGASRAHPSPRLLNISVLSTGVCWSVTRCCCCSVDGPRLSLSNTSIKLCKQITDGETQNYGVIRNSSGVLTGHQWTQELILLLFHYGTAERHQLKPCGPNHRR